MTIEIKHIFTKYSQLHSRKMTRRKQNLVHVKLKINVHTTTILTITQNHWILGKESDFK